MPHHPGIIDVDQGRQLPAMEDPAAPPQHCESNLAAQKLYRRESRFFAKFELMIQR